MTYEIDVTPASDPLGTILTTLGNDDLLAGTRFRPVKLGSGMVQVVIDADSVKAGALEDEVFLRIRDTVIGSYIYSGSLSNAQVKLVSENKDRRVLTWSGLGALGPLARMTLGEDIYALGPPVQVARGSYDVPGMWTWTNQPYGAIGRRMFEEGRDHPDNPFASMTVTFDRDGQTGGAPWTLFPELHQEQVGTNVLDAYVNLIKAGVIFELTPGLVLNAWETFGSDHSGPAFAADVVRFMVAASALDSAANILTDAERAWSSSRLSELIVVGADNVTEKVTDPTAPFGKVGVYHYPQSSDPAVLTAVGNAELQRRLLRTIGALKLPVILEDDPLNGHYLPGPGRPCWIGNTASAVTGSAAYDFDAAFPTAALDFLLTDAYGWTCEAELGSAFIDSRQRAQDFAVRQIVKSSTPGPHPHPELFCGSASYRVTRLVRAADNTHEFGYSEPGGGAIVFTDSGVSSDTNVDHGLIGPFASTPVWRIKDATCGHTSLITDGPSEIFVEHGPLAAGPEAWKPTLPAGAYRLYWTDEDADCSGNADPDNEGSHNLVVQIEPEGDLPGPTVETWQANPGIAPRGLRCDVAIPHGLDLWQDLYHRAVGISYDDSLTGLGASNVQEAIEAVAVGGSGLGWFNIRSYGAVGDDTTDDTVAIQDTIAACLLAGGSIVYFPEGTYKITAALNIQPAASGGWIRLLGPGAPDGTTDTTRGAIIRQATANTTAIEGGTNLYDLYVEQLKLTSASGFTAGDGIDAKRNVYCKDVRIVGFYNGYHLNGAVGAQSYYSKNYRLYVHGATNAGVLLEKEAYNAEFFACRLQFSAIGLHAKGALSLRAWGGSIEQNTSYGVLIDSAGGSGGSTRGVLLAGVYLENATGTDIRVGNSANTVYSTTIDTCFFGSTGTTWYIDAQYVDGLTIRGCDLLGGSRSKIRATSPAVNVTVGYNTGSGDYGTMPSSTIYLDPDGLDARYIGGVEITGTPTVGQVPVATDGDSATWQDPDLGSGDPGYHFEAIMTGSGVSLEPIQSNDGTDWVYGKVYD